MLVTIVSLPITEYCTAVVNEVNVVNEYHSHKMCSVVNSKPLNIIQILNKSLNIETLLFGYLTFC